MRLAPFPSYWMYIWFILGQRCRLGTTMSQGKRPFWSLLRKSNLFLRLSYENIQVPAIFFFTDCKLNQEVQRNSWFKKFRKIPVMKSCFTKTVAFRLVILKKEFRKKNIFLQYFKMNIFRKTLGEKNATINKFHDVLEFPLFQ